MLAKVAMEMIAFQEDKCRMKNLLSFISLPQPAKSKKACKKIVYIYEKTFGAEVPIFRLLISLFENKEFRFYLFCIVPFSPMLEVLTSFLFEK